MGAGIEALLAEWRGGVVSPGSSLATMYARRWSMYENTAFDDSSIWTNAYQRAGLYRGMRPLYNPTRRVVRFYTGAIYPGVLSEDGSALPDGWSLAMPLAKDTPEELKQAIAALWRWTNFATQKNQIVRWGAACGDLLVRAVDDVPRGKVYFEPVWPAEVTGLLLDIQGNVKAYARSFPETMLHEGGFKYDREMVDKEEFRFYLGESIVASYANPYGFVPAVFVRHEDVGNLPKSLRPRHEDVGRVTGAPALAGSYEKVNHLMALASHIHDQVHKIVENRTILATSATEFNVSNIKRDEVDDESALQLDAETADVLLAPPDTSVLHLYGNLSLSDALSLMQSLQQEIENDQPVLGMYDQLRSMSTLTGPAAERMVGDGANLVYEAQGQYDRPIIALHQMATAIAGWRYDQRTKLPAYGDVNGWARNTEQQQKFAPFNLDSYDQGDLDFVIMPRPLLPETKQERALAKTTRFAALKAAQDAGLTLEEAMAELDWTEAEIIDFMARRAARANQGGDADATGTSRGQALEGDARGSQAPTQQGEAGPAQAA